MIVLASDHGGLQLKEAVKALLIERGIPFEDCGTDNGDSVDYPDYGEKAARKVAAGAAEKGVLFCGTGIGMSIVANKFPHVRAALVIGGRVIDGNQAREMVATWLDATFEGGRHQGRLDKIATLEQEIYRTGCRE